MGRGLISDDVINQIRDRVDIADIVGQHVALTRAGQNLKGLCPFHQEKVPVLHGQPVTADFPLFWLRGRRQCVHVSDEITGASFPEIGPRSRAQGRDRMCQESTGGYSSRRPARQLGPMDG